MGLHSALPSDEARMSEKTKCDHLGHPHTVREDEQTVVTWCVTCNRVCFVARSYDRTDEKAP